MIYIHIPFCRSFCTYCDFYSEVAAKCRKTEDATRQEALFGAFADALVTEIKARGSEITDEVNTLYIGGGTPSVLPLSVFERVLSALQEIGCGGPYKEFTVEVNPEDIVEKGEAYVEGLLKLGVNRISMGVQSFDDSVLKFMNRRHDASTARKAYCILESAGVSNISIDLIFGLPQLSDDQWAETLGQALSISPSGSLPKHISSYQLSVEEGSILAKMVSKGLWSEASEEICSRQYSILCDVLRSAGYNHYEISNFALPGYEAVHNSAYWKHIPYVGLGPGAHSFLEICGGTDCLTLMNADGAGAVCGNKSESGCGAACGNKSESGCDAACGNGTEYIRQWNKPDLKAYIADPVGCTESETLTPEQLTIERIMLGLRTSEGLPASYLEAHCNPQTLQNALSTGHLEVVSSNYEQNAPFLLISPLRNTPKCAKQPVFAHFPSESSPQSIIPDSPHVLPDSSHVIPDSPYVILNSIQDLPSHIRIPERHFFISDSIIADLI